MTDSPSSQEANKLQARAAFLHSDCGMAWEEADACALREVGIGDDEISELVGESGVMVAGSTGVAIMNYDEVCAFARHCLVHTPLAASTAREAEVKRLRTALSRIAGYTLSQFMGPHDMALECVTAAREALKEIQR